MNLHPECRATPCSPEHRCRAPESVRIAAGVDDSRIVGVRLKPGYPSRAAGGAAAAGSRAPLGAGGGGGAMVPDPLESDWHKQLVSSLLFFAGPVFFSLCVVRACVLVGWLVDCEWCR